MCGIATAPSSTTWGRSVAVSEISVVDLARRTMYPRRQLASRFVHLASLFSPGNREEDRLVLVLPPFVFICPFAARRAVIRINLPDNRLLLRRRIYHHSLSFTGQLNGKFVLFFRPNRSACICIFTRIVFHHCTHLPGCTTCFLR